MVNTFQKTAARLENFWRSKGCIITNSYDIEMGAATFHPETIMSVIRNRPRKVAFMQPCRRPQDSRGGKSPNRLYKHHQFQVIIMPPPPDIQIMVINSLYECGVDPRKHSIDFVENNWQSPSMGAAGKGYEVQCNGAEVLQFTYFQQIAGQDLDLVPIELAYGLERLCLVIQDKEHMFDIVWDRVDEVDITYRDVHGAFEQEHAAAIYPKESLKNLFTFYEEICIDLSKANEMLPAYEMFLKLSHLFNLIESAGGLSVNERVSFLARTRKCANLCLGKRVQGRGDDD